MTHKTLRVAGYGNRFLARKGKSIGRRGRRNAPAMSVGAGFAHSVRSA